MDKSKYIITGGNRLSGEYTVEAAKNAVLPLLAASIMNCKKVTLKNCQRISDVENMIGILTSLGASVSWENGDIHIDSSSAYGTEIPGNLAREIRSSIFMMGSILSRHRKAKVAYPGGCEIGIRPIDLHIKGLKALNVKITEEHGYILCDGMNMRGANVQLDCPSVGATENIMMSAVLCEGRTEIRNAAKEPEIIDLMNIINAMGGKVSGAGTSTIIIDGVDSLTDCEYTPMPDRIVAGTLLIGAAMTCGKIKLNNCNPEHLYSLITKLRDAGCIVSSENNTVSLDCRQRPESVQMVETMPYPGFPTDLQAQMTALQSVSNGICMVIENMFETRYKFVPELVKMGAGITVRDRMAIVRGVQRLSGAEVLVHDLRGGAALVLAGLNAHGTTTIHNVPLIDRGYYNLETKLQALGADIRRER